MEMDAVRIARLRMGSFARVSDKEVVKKHVTVTGNTFCYVTVASAASHSVLELNLGALAIDQMDALRFAVLV